MPNGSKKEKTETKKSIHSEIRLDKYPRNRDAEESKKQRQWSC